MFKLLLLLLGVWIVLTLLKQRRHHSASEIKNGNMVRCAVCDVHLPENEAITNSGRHYCSEAHFLQREQT